LEELLKLYKVRKSCKGSSCLVFEIFWPKTVCSPPSWFIIDLINWVFDDVTSRVNLLKRLHVGLNFFEKFLKMLWVNWVLKRQDKNFTFYPTCAWRMHIECISKMAECTLLLIKISRKPSKIRNNCKGSLYIILNVLSNKTNLIYIAIFL
jgi:hypothetical protein